MCTGWNDGGRTAAATQAVQGWHQKWRGPLRDALDGLRDAVAPQFEEHAQLSFKDPWAARNDYVSILLDRQPATINRFFPEARASRP